MASGVPTISALRERVFDVLTHPSDNVPLLATVFILFSAYSVAKYYRSPWRSLPPGPKGLPLIGNALQLRSHAWLKFTEWRKSYGDIIYLNAAGQPIIVFNSQKVAFDLMERRANIYSDRPNNIVANDIMTEGLLFVFSHYTDVWRRMKKASHEALNKSISPKYQESQFSEALVLTLAMGKQPVQWAQHIKRAAASFIMGVAYDKPPIESENDPAVVKVNEFVARLTRAALPGSHLVEFFTWMKYLPSWMAAWKRKAQQDFITDSAMFIGLFKEVQTRVEAGDERFSFSAQLVKDAKRNNLSERENAWLAGTMYAGGAETTAGVLTWFILAMVAYPETQKRAQAELDAVVGRDRVPTFNDRDQLPYIAAIMKEILRWKPVGPLGLPHRSTEDDWYEGYFIPKGSICIANVWHLNRDPEIYGSDADEFKPERHLDAKGQVIAGSKETHEESHFTYGFGRRLCVGRHVANQSLFIDIALMLWGLNIERGREPDGSLSPIELDEVVEDGVVIRPIPFKTKITPRFPDSISLVEKEQEMLVG